MIELIPAIDIMNGRCVRLSRGDYSCRKVYDENPLEVAKAFQDNGLNRLHLVDLDGAKADHVVNYRTLEQIATHTTLSVDFGGGIKSDEDLRIAFECGADMVTGGSIAVKNRSLFLQWLDRYGKEHIIFCSQPNSSMFAAYICILLAKITHFRSPSLNFSFVV